MTSSTEYYPSNHQIAETIFEQMGGKNKLSAMVAADNFVYNPDPEFPSATFKFKGSSKANCCIITYVRGRDTYDFCLRKMIMPTKRNGFKFESKTHYELTDVYADMLKPIFEKHTGLYLSL